jgi:hypothetical protein
MSFKPPIVTVLSQSTDSLGLLTRLTGNAATYGAPLAPGGLYDVETQGKEALQLHKLVLEAKDECVFRTYTDAEQSNIVGQHFVFRPWWTKRAWGLVTDTSLVWSHAKYPADGSHTHCELTYEAIGADEKIKSGYVSGNNWVTPEAYERFVLHDEYHCRDDG